MAGLSPFRSMRTLCKSCVRASLGLILFVGTGCVDTESQTEQPPPATAGLPDLTPTGTPTTFALPDLPPIGTPVPEPTLPSSAVPAFDESAYDGAYGRAVTTTATPRDKLNYLLPQPTGSYQYVVDDSAIRYVGRLSVIVQQSSFKLLLQSVGRFGACAVENGVLAVQAVAKKDLSAAGVVAIASKNQATDPSVWLSCLPGGFLLGGGPVSPCATSFRYENVEWPDGIVDTYYVFVAATSQDVCNELATPSDGLHTAPLA